MNMMLVICYSGVYPHRASLKNMPGHGGKICKVEKYSWPFFKLARCTQSNITSIIIIWVHYTNVRQISFTLLLNGCCNSNSAQYERNRRFRQLAHALAWKDNGAKLPSVGLWLNASKSESVLERNDSFLWTTYANKNSGATRRASCVTTCSRSRLCT